ncbi:restriction endonuclease subunit S [Cohnella terricola]|uniref:Restriction endonuclease subunit S n=1 Tax=Cohnella terricola TaxID=1289167 RepID=A0A559JGS1_9BACL|nr:restriction endonuclease subunit S [Cohnella terricola]TVX99074.1 restriction endonuclease subunit S [Cohnella terricola]
MSVDWPIQTLGEVCEKITDGAHNSPKSVDHGKPMASVKDLTRFGIDLSNARLISQEDFEKLVKQGCQPEVGDVLIAKDGNSALDTVCTVDEPTNVVLLSSVAILRPHKDKLDSDFLKYYFSSKQVIEYLKNNFISGAAIPRVVLKDLRKAEIKVPPLYIQKGISKKLRALDDKIKLNNQINDTLESIVQAIFKSWFVDFEPVKAKMRALQAGHSNNEAEHAAMRAISGKDETELKQLQQQKPEYFVELTKTAAVFPSTMEESNLGCIPEGWTISEIGNEVTVVGGGTPSTKNNEFWDGGIFLWATPKDLSNLREKVLIDTERKITEEGLKRISSGLLPVNTVLMSSRAPVGYLAIAKVPLAINQGFIAMNCNKILSSEYVLQWCSFQMDEIKQRASGTTFAEISKKSFNPIPVVVPMYEVIEKFTNHVKFIYSKIEQNIQESMTLSQLKESLLPKLLSGEIELIDEEY